MGRAEMDTSDFDKFISKPNRRRIIDEEQKGQLIVGGMPPTGIHKPSRKVRNRRLNQAIKKAIR